ncbi:MAG: molybdopterin-guanine dinucleotide biosynthesis protein B [Desulfobulbus sp.]|nr:MAG: molybdopterin-guanine dinucleotide biosynthesis protein B [Desulfobulbus sp.]
MPPIITFIGWHDCGKTTLASSVVNHLKRKGYTVAVIKSTKDTGLVLDQEGTDTFSYRQAGADAVTLIAPDQMVMMTHNPDKQLTTLAHRYFADVDLVIGEGFKDERKIAKIEVSRGETELLRDRVTGVIAIATDRDISGDYIFRLDESQELAEFIEKRFLGEQSQQEEVILLINGRKVVMKDFVQQALTGTVAGFVKTLKTPRNSIKTIELRIRTQKK